MTSSKGAALCTPKKNVLHDADFSPLHVPLNLRGLGLSKKAEVGFLLLVFQMSCALLVSPIDLGAKINGI